MDHVGIGIDIVHPGARGRPPPGPSRHMLRPRARRPAAGVTPRRAAHAHRQLPQYRLDRDAADPHHETRPTTGCTSTCSWPGRTPPAPRPGRGRRPRRGSAAADQRLSRRGEVPASGTGVRKILSFRMMPSCEHEGAGRSRHALSTCRAQGAGRVRGRGPTGGWATLLPLDRPGGGTQRACAPTASAPEHFPSRDLGDPSGAPAGIRVGQQRVGAGSPRSRAAMYSYAAGNPTTAVLMCSEISYGTNVTRAPAAQYRCATSATES